MRVHRRFLGRLARDARGTALIETTIVAPVLVLLALGTFETGSIVAKQMQLQSAAAQAAQIAAASPPDTADERTTLQGILMASTGLPADNVIVSELYRCGASASTTTNSSTCGTTPFSSYVRVELSDSYTPRWVQFGVGSRVDLRVSRTMQIG